MNTTTPDPATLRVFNVRRKADRAIMRDTLRTHCNRPGIVADVKEENRTITAHIVTDSGLCATFVISPNYPDTVIHWFMHHEAKGTIDPIFTTEINPNHRRKATTFASDFWNLCRTLDSKLNLIINGEAVILPAIEPIHPDKQPTNTTMQTLQPNPVNVARKATSTHKTLHEIATTLRHLFNSDNDAPRLFADAFADVLTKHGWNDPRTAEHHDEEYSDLQTELDEANKKIEEIESRITELEAEIEDLTDEC